MLNVAKLNKLENSFISGSFIGIRRQPRTEKAEQIAVSVARHKRPLCHEQEKDFAHGITASK
jgi:hypothetical protein